MLRNDRGDASLRRALGCGRGRDALKRRPYNCGLKPGGSISPIGGRKTILTWHRQECLCHLAAGGWGGGGCWLLADAEAEDFALVGFEDFEAEAFEVDLVAGGGDFAGDVA